MSVPFHGEERVRRKSVFSQTRFLFHHNMCLEISLLLSFWLLLYTATLKTNRSTLSSSAELLTPPGLKVFKYFIIFNAIVNGFVSLISCLNYSVFFYRNTTHIQMWILCHANLLSLFFSSPNFCMGFQDFLYVRSLHLLIEVHLVLYFSLCIFHFFHNFYGQNSSILLKWQEQASMSYTGT